MNSKLETLLISWPAKDVLLVALNRPEVMNAINTRLAEEMIQLFSCKETSAKARCIVLTGTGDRAFSAGGDLKERHGMTDRAWFQQHALFEEMTLRVLEYSGAVIASVNGIAFGGGCELALCCDFIYAARTARFALTETRLGIMPGGGGTQNLPRAVGTRRAKELIFSAQPFSADEAAAWGMVNRLCEPQDLLQESTRAATAIASCAPLSIVQAKKAINYGMQLDLKTALQFEIESYGRLVGTEDRQEGVLAFNEKRAPKFSGR
jgi:enoyl-CoA hydratase